MRPDTITLAIQEKLTPEEKLDLAGKVTEKWNELNTARDDKKASDGVFNERIKRFESEFEPLMEKLSKGYETAQVGCDIRYDHPEPGKKSYFRMDRNELVETHDMTWEEKQETIQFPLAGEKPEEPNVELSAEDRAKFEAAELNKVIGDVTPCDHPSVSGDGTGWRCDKCGEMLSEHPKQDRLPTEEFNQDVPRILPADEPPPPTDEASA